MILRVDDIHFGYGPNVVLDDIRLHLEPGEFKAVLGNNGAGKSTLLKCLAGIITPSRGTMTLDGEDLATCNRNEIAQRLGYVPQQAERSSMTVFDAVLLGRKPYIRWDASHHDYHVVEHVLARLGLEPFALRPLNELSGGELQKTMIARALAQEPRVLLLDEPTSSLDLRNQLDVLGTVKRVTAEEGVAVIAVMHDLNLAMRFADEFLFLSEGKVFASGDHNVVTPENVAHVYGVPVAIQHVADMRTVVPL